MRQVTSNGSLFGLGFPWLRKPGSGHIVGAIKPSKGDLIPVYGPAPIKSGKRYRDPGYPGSVRRQRAAV